MLFRSVEAEGTQNAKERNSIRTRNSFAEDYERYLTKLFAVLLQYEDYINGNTTATDRATGKSAIVAEEYHGIKAAFRKYIVDTPEEVAEVLARKVQANIMSVFAAVREQHPDWSDEAVYNEANLIYAQKSNELIQVVDPNKPPPKKTPPPKENPDGDDEDAQKDLQDKDNPDGEQIGRAHV